MIFQRDTMVGSHPNTPVCGCIHVSKLIQVVAYKQTYLFSNQDGQHISQRNNTLGMEILGAYIESVNKIGCQSANHKLE